MDLKKDIYDKARELGAELVGTCSTDMWDLEPIQAPGFRPLNIWPWARRAIVMAIPLFYPMASTAPSMLYQEQYEDRQSVYAEAYRIDRHYGRKRMEPFKDNVDPEDPYSADDAHRDERG